MKIVGMLHVDAGTVQSVAAASCALRHSGRTCNSQQSQHRCVRLALPVWLPGAAARQHCREQARSQTNNLHLRLIIPRSDTGCQDFCMPVRDLLLVALAELRTSGVAKGDIGRLQFLLSNVEMAAVSRIRAWVWAASIHSRVSHAQNVARTDLA